MKNVRSHLLFCMTFYIIGQIHHNPQQVVLCELLPFLEKSTLKLFSYVIKKMILDKKFVKGSFLANSANNNKKYLHEIKH